MADDLDEQHEDQPTATRRAFLSGAGAVAATALTAAACRGESTGVSDTAAESASVPPTAAPAPTPVPSATPAVPSSSEVTFSGQRQVGLLIDAAPAGLVATFDVVSDNPDELATTFQVISAEIERLMTNTVADEADEFLPPVDSGAVGAESGTAGVAVTLAVGASLFDERFGLADRRPRELILMPRFFNDRLVSDDLSHGDLAVTISAPNQQLAVFALHQIVRVTERRLRIRWIQEGYNQRLPTESGGIAPTRNLLGFRDGTSNPDAENQAEMDQVVWVGADDDEPAWAVGGSYQAVRVIRMLIEFWATAALVRQEQIFGRHRDTGAPLGQTNEGDTPSFVSDPDDDLIPRRSHIRLANPRTPGTGRILRRGFSYLNGAATDGTMDQGLIFLCYQRALSTGFLEVQSRLDGEPLEDYIKPVGGGLFFVLPGPGPNGWLGQSLLAT